MSVVVLKDFTTAFPCMQFTAPLPTGFEAKEPQSLISSNIAAYLLSGSVSGVAFIEELSALVIDLPPAVVTPKRGFCKLYPGNLAFFRGSVEFWQQVAPDELLHVEGILLVKSGTLSCITWINLDAPVEFTLPRQKLVVNLSIEAIDSTKPIQVT